MAEEMNAAANVADSQAAGDVTGQDADKSSIASDGADTKGQTTDDSDQKMTKRMSERINQINKKHEEELTLLKNQLEEYERKEKEWQQKELELKALEQGITLDELKQQMADEERQRKEMLENSPEYKQFMQEKYQSEYTKAVEALRSAYPDDNIEKLEDLGDLFVKQLQILGDPVEAYKVVKLLNDKAAAATAKATAGSVKSDGDLPKGRTYTREDVRNMTPAQINADYDNVIASMKTWT